MLSDLLLLCFIGHVIGDYYLATKGKNDVNGKIGKLLLHSVIYIIPYVLLFILFGRTRTLFFAFLLVCTAHFLIDLLGLLAFKVQCIYKKLGTKKFTTYVIRHVLYILSILLVAFVFPNDHSGIRHDALIHIITNAMNLDLSWTLQWVLLVLCIYKPVNAAIITAFSNYKPPKQEENADAKKAGAVIGFLERFLIILFIYLKQYSAIGLILTAKSIARYDRISKSQDFAEYYLIGTLSSLLSAILLYFIIFQKG